jgi:hypothetical protein
MEKPTDLENCGEVFDYLIDIKKPSHGEFAPGEAFMLSGSEIDPNIGSPYPEHLFKSYDCYAKGTYDAYALIYDDINRKIYLYSPEGNIGRFNYDLEEE